MTGRWFRLLALWCAGWLLAVGAAQAQNNLLFITTQDDPLPPPGVTNGGGGAVAIANARAAFQAQATASGLSFVDRTNALSDSTSLTADLAAAKMVVLMTIYGPADAARMGEINTALSSRPDLAMLAFVDGCCSQTANINTFVPMINGIKPWTPNVTVPKYQDFPVTAPVNPASPYHTSFPATLVGGYYSHLANVPAEYTLYNDPVPVGGVVGAYGLFIPQAASNSGNGACLFMLADVTPFYDGIQPAQTNAIASAFAGAALDPAGACKLPAAGVVDLAVSLTGPATLVPGTAATYTLGVNNVGVVDSGATTVTVTLPSGVTATGTPPAGCTFGAGNTTVSCSVGVLTAGTGSASFPIQLVAAPGAAGGNASATVPNQTGEVNTANNATTLPMAVAVTDLAVGLTGPATLTPGTPAGYTLSVTNAAGAAPSSATTVTVALPPGVTATGTPPAGCTYGAGGTTVTCNVAALPSGGSANFPIQLLATAGAAGGNAQVSVPNQPGEVITTNNATTLPIAIGAVPAAVPTLDAWALIALGGLLPLLAARRRRRQS